MCFELTVMIRANPTESSFQEINRSSVKTAFAKAGIP
jgi:hypothetical protein